MLQVRQFVSDRGPVTATTVDVPTSPADVLRAQLEQLPADWIHEPIEAEVERVAAVTERRHLLLAARDAAQLAADEALRADPLDVEVAVAAQTRLAALDVLVTRLPGEQLNRAVFAPLISRVMGELRQVHSEGLLPRPAYDVEVEQYRSSDFYRGLEPPVRTEKDPPLHDALELLMEVAQPWGAGVSRLLAKVNDLPPFDWLRPAAAYLEQAGPITETVRKLRLAVEQLNGERAHRGLVWQPPAQYPPRLVPESVNVFGPSFPHANPTVL